MGLKAVLGFCERWLGRWHLLSWLLEMRWEAMIALGAVGAALHWLWNQVVKINPLIVFLGAVIAFAKVYLCRAQSNLGPAGSLLVFYKGKSKDVPSQAMTAIGVFEDCSIAKSTKDLMLLTGGGLSTVKLNSTTGRRPPLGRSRLFTIFLPLTSNHQFHWTNCSRWA
jgi:hypothetical protein